MLKRSLIPTALIEPEERERIRIEHRSIHLRLRGLIVAAGLLHLALPLVWLRVTRRLDDRELGRRLASFCERMGVLWMKVGQLLSIRGELLPQDARDELARLQDRASGFDPDTAIRLLERELGRTVPEVFAEFERIPFAAASISQVHRAKLKREGTWVAVKVQRPHVERVFARDMALLKGLVKVMRFLSVMPHVRWDDLLWELEHLVREEIDYRFEATNMRRMKKTLKPHNIYVPKVFRGHSTRRILTMEFIHGVFLSEYLQVSHRDPERVARWRDENKIRRSRVARRVLFSHLRQSLEDNLFHCDLHPGNLVLLRDSQIALIDFGSVGFAERDFLRKYDLYMDALSTGQYSKMVDLYWLFVVNLPPTDLSDLKEQAVRRLQAWEARRRTFDLPYEQRSLGSLSDELIRLVGEQGISLDWTFLRLNRAWFTMDISFRELMPHADIKKLTLEYYRQKERRSRRALLPSPVSAAQWFQAAIELPSHAYEQAIYRGAVIRRLAMVFEGTTTRFSNLFASIFGFFRWAVVLTVAAALLGMLQQVAGLAVGAPGFPTSALASLPPLDAQVWALVMVVLLHVHRTLTLLKRRFEQGEAKVPGA